MQLIKVRSTSVLGKRAAARLRRYASMGNGRPPIYDGFLLKVDTFGKFTTGTVIDLGCKIVGRVPFGTADRSEWWDTTTLNYSTDHYPHVRMGVTRDVVASSQAGDEADLALKDLQEPEFTPDIAIGDVPPANPGNHDSHSFEVPQKAFGELASVQVHALVTPGLTFQADLHANLIRDENQAARDEAAAAGFNSWWFFGGYFPPYRTTQAYEYDGWWLFELIQPNGRQLNISVSEAWVTQHYPGYYMISEADAYSPPVPKGTANACKRGSMVYLALCVTKTRSELIMAPEMPPPPLSPTSPELGSTDPHNDYDSGQSAMLILAYDLAANQGEGELLWHTLYELDTETDARLKPHLVDEAETFNYLDPDMVNKFMNRTYWKVEQTLFYKAHGYRPNDFLTMDMVAHEEGVRIVTNLAIVIPEYAEGFRRNDTPANGTPPEDADPENRFIAASRSSYQSTSIIRLDLDLEGALTRTVLASEFAYPYLNFDLWDLTPPPNQIRWINPNPYASEFDSFSATRTLFDPDLYKNDYKRVYTNVQFFDEAGTQVVVTSINMCMTEHLVDPEADFNPGAVPAYGLYVGNDTNFGIFNAPEVPVPEWAYCRYIVNPISWPGGGYIEINPYYEAIVKKPTAYWEIMDATTGTVLHEQNTDTLQQAVGRELARPPYKSGDCSYPGSMNCYTFDTTVVIPGRAIAFCGYDEAGTNQQHIVQWDLEQDVLHTFPLPRAPGKFPMQWLHCYSHATIEEPDKENVMRLDAAFVYCMYRQAIDFGLEGHKFPPTDPFKPGPLEFDSQVWVSVDGGQTWAPVAQQVKLGSPAVVGNALWKRKVGDFTKDPRELDYVLE